MDLQNRMSYNGRSLTTHARRVQLMSTNTKKKRGTGAAAVIIVLTNFVKKTKGWHPIVFIGLSALAGVVFRFAGA